MPPPHPPAAVSLHSFHPWNGWAWARALARASIGSAGWYLLADTSKPRRSQFCFAAQVGIDDALVKQKFDTDEEIFEMNNGCICCTVKAAPRTRLPLALPTVHISSPVRSRFASGNSQLPSTYLLSQLPPSLLDSNVNNSSAALCALPRATLPPPSDHPSSLVPILQLSFCL